MSFRRPKPRDSASFSKDESRDRVETKVDTADPVNEGLAESWVPHGFCLESSPLILNEHLDVARQVLKDRKVPLPPESPAATFEQKKNQLCTLLLDTNVSLVRPSESPGQSHCETTSEAPIPPERLIRLRMGRGRGIQCWDILELLQELAYVPAFAARFTPYQRERIARHLQQLDFEPHVTTPCHLFSDNETLCTKQDEGRRCRYNKRTLLGAVFARGTQSHDEGECYVETKYVKQLMERCSLDTTPFNQVQAVAYDVFVPNLIGRHRRDLEIENEPLSVLAGRPGLSVFQEFILETTQDGLLDDIRRQIYETKSRQDLCECIQDSLIAFERSRATGLESAAHGFLALAVSFYRIGFEYIPPKDIGDVWSRVSPTVGQSARVIEITAAVINLTLTFALPQALVVRGLHYLSFFKLAVKAFTVTRLLFRIHGFRLLGRVFKPPTVAVAVMAIVIGFFLNTEFVKEYVTMLSREWSVRALQVDEVLFKAGFTDLVSADPGTLVGTLLPVLAVENTPVIAKAIAATLSASTASYAERVAEKEAEMQAQAEEAAAEEDVVIVKTGTEPVPPPQYAAILPKLRRAVAAGEL